MATLNAKKTLAAVTLAAVTLTAPAIAHANNYNNTNYSYEDCKRADSENQLVGGLIGAVAGGVFGSQVAGRGARTEGSAIGAVLGAGLGAVIGDDQRNCGSNSRTDVIYNDAPRSVNSGYTTSNRGSSSRTVYTSPRIQTVYNTSGYGTSSRGNGYNTAGQDRLYRIERSIDSLRSERAELKSRRNYRYDRYVCARLEEIDYKLAALKKQEKQIKREIRLTERNYNRGNTYNRSY